MSLLIAFMFALCSILNGWTYLDNPRTLPLVSTILFDDVFGPVVLHVAHGPPLPPENPMTRLLDTLCGLTGTHRQRLCWTLTIGLFIAGIAAGILWLVMEVIG